MTELLCDIILLCDIRLTALLRNYHAVVIGSLERVRGRIDE